MGWSQLNPPCRVHCSLVANPGCEEMRPKSAWRALPPLERLPEPLLLVAMPQEPLPWPFPKYVVTGSFWSWLALLSKEKVRDLAVVGRVGLGINTMPLPPPEGSTLRSWCGGGPMMLKRRNRPTHGSQEVPPTACETLSTGPGNWPFDICCRLTRSTVWPAL